MEIKVLEKDNIKDKLLTRALYEESFGYDGTEYIDYYYSEIIRRNEIICGYENGKIISMIHLNPYLFSVCGKETILYYMVAVTTSKECRHEGHMFDLMSDAFKYLKTKSILFCYLIPDTEELQHMYEKIGFIKICDFNINKFETKIENVDIYPVRTNEFNLLMKNEQYFLDKESDAFRENLKKKIVLGHSLCDNIEKYVNKNIYICQEV